MATQTLTALYIVRVSGATALRACPPTCNDARAGAARARSHPRRPPPRPPALQVPEMGWRQHKQAYSLIVSRQRQVRGAAFGASATSASLLSRAPRPTTARHPTAAPPCPP
jgi:hypothetical protein